MILILAMLLTGLPQEPRHVASDLPSQSTFRAANVVTRRRVMKEVDVRVTASPASTLELLEAGLSDSDFEVRLTAAAGVRQLLSAAMLLRVRDQVSIQLPTSLIDALSQSVDSEESTVRFHAINALVYFAHDKAHVQERITGRYHRESVPLLRAQLLGHLRDIAGDQHDIREIILAALDDQAPEVRIQAARGIARWTPNEALPKVAARLSEADEGSREAFIDALAAYGRRGAAHVHLLEQLLASEPSERGRRHIEEAIASIRR